jgi:hypothetical protein
MSVTVDQIKLAKSKLEYDIATLLNEFTARMRLAPSDIEVSLQEVTNMSSPNREYRASVCIKVEL